MVTVRKIVCEEAKTICHSKERCRRQKQLAEEFFSFICHLAEDQRKALTDLLPGSWNLCLVSFYTKTYKNHYKKPWS